jgi:N-methylhydantoinase B
MPELDYDAITLSVLLGRFDSVVNEMSITLERTAWTTIIAICKDFSCAVYDAVPRQISMFDAVPVHTTSMHLVLEEIASKFAGRLHDGDVFVCNDPHRGNTHIGDLVTACPVFVDGEHSFWSVAKGHQLDTGAFVASSVTAAAQNVWQEGVTIPPLKLVDRGELREDIVELYLANVRYGDLVGGDLRAQLASIEKGRQRLVEMCEEYGLATVRRYVDVMIAYADRRMGAAVAKMPDGVYEAEGWVDSDGFELLNIPVKVKVTVAGERVTVDMSGSAPQVKGGLNGSYAVACAAGAAPFLFYVDADIPHNQGCLEHIKVIAPQGTICNARYPASTSVATGCPSDTIQDTIHKAMTHAIPERVPAGGTKDANLPQFSGSAGDELWGVMVFNGTGGGGAARGVDGWPIYEAVSSAGAIRIQQVEELELLHPLRIERVEIEPDSCGFGQWIGGPGTRLVVRPLAEVETECITFSDGMSNPPHGVLGGTMGCGGGAYVEEVGGRRRYISPCGIVRMHPGELWVGVSTGGGGYGDPLQRPAQRVLKDLRDGFITPTIAEEVFGLVLAADGSTLDQAASEERRAQLGTRDRSLIDPQRPGASTWVREHMREGDVYLLNPM